MSVLDGTIGASRILFGNIGNDTLFTVTATTEATTFDVENAIDGRSRNTWRSTAITQTYVTFNGTSAHNIKGVYINNHNITGGSVTFDLETSDDNFSSTDTTDAFTTVTRTETEEVNGVIQSVSYNDAYVFKTVSKQDFRISMIQTATNTYHELGMIYVFSDDFEIPGPCIRWGATRGPESIITPNTSQFGGQNESFQFQRHVEGFEYPKIPVEFMSKMALIGANPQVVYMPDGLTGKHFLGKLRFNSPVELLGGQDFQITGSFEGAK